MIARPVSRPVSRGVSRRVNEFSGGGWTPPDDAKYLDFQNDRYSANGVPSGVSSLSSFARLSSATMWLSNNLIDVPENTPRISSAGLLVEKSATELIPNNSTITSINTAWAATSKPDTQVGNSFEFVSNGSAATVSTNIPVYPAGNVSASSGYYYRSILAKKASADSFLYFGSSSADASIVVNLKNGSLDYNGVRVVEIKISDINEYYLIETLSTETSASARQFYFHASNNRGTASVLPAPTIGHKVTVALPSFRDTSDFPQSVVKTSGTQVTRAKETLIVPFTTGQTVTADKDAGVTMTIVDNNAVFEGHGYIKSVRVN